MRIAIASDQAGHQAKQSLAMRLNENGHEVVDAAPSIASRERPDYAEQVALLRAAPRCRTRHHHHQSRCGRVGHRQPGTGNSRRHVRRPAFRASGSTRRRHERTGAGVARVGRRARARGGGRLSAARPSQRSKQSADCRLGGCSACSLTFARTLRAKCRLPNWPRPWA